MKHPFDRKVFFTQSNDEFLSYREVQGLMRSGKLTLSDFVFDTDGGAYPVQHVITNKAPRWLQDEPMLDNLPPLSEEDARMVDELLSEPDCIEMPKEPAVKSVSHYLERHPRIARMVVDAERWMLR